MSFWDLRHPEASLALVDEASGEAWSYQRLTEAVATFNTERPAASRKQLGFLLCLNTPGSLIGYLGALQQGDAVCLLSAGLDSLLLDSLLETYQPDWIWAPEDQAPLAGYQPHLRRWESRLWIRNAESDHVLHPDLALLLSTSGTTGSPKLVRLSYENLQANAEAICAYLGLTAGERPVTTLPMHYSYGLSVINSHLQAGATILLTEKSLATREFWEFLKTQQATSLAGVPYTYQMLHRMRLERMELPALRTLTQAGGRLEDKLAIHFSQIALDKGWKFFRMYGQTEATARISFIPPECALSKIGSIGISIPGGRLMLDADTQELIYQGPNVMLGYAEDPEDLAKGDELGGTLRTGDVARVDEEGYYYLTGRMKRFLKLFGLRISLDEVERHLERHVVSPVVCLGEDERLCVVLEDASKIEAVKAVLNATYKIRTPSVRVQAVEALPRSFSGKVDYPRLKEMVTG